MRQPVKLPIAVETVARAVAMTCTDPPYEGRPHWRGRAMAKATGISLRLSQRICGAHDLSHIVSASLNGRTRS